MAEPNLQIAPSLSPAELLPDPSPRTGSRSAMLIVFLVVFVDLLGFGIVLPLLSLYGDTFVKNALPGNKDSAVHGAVIGLVMSVFSLMQFVGAPIWGRISDRVGRRPILLLGLGGSAFFYLLFGWASGLDPETQAVLALTLIFVARIGAGLSGATISTAQAVIADCTTPEKRKMGMAMIGAAFGIGFTFGPLLGFAALTFFPQHVGVTGYAASLLSLTALLLGWFLLPETRRLEATDTSRRWLDLNVIGAALRSPAIGPVVLVFFLASLGFSSFEVTLAMVNRDSLGVPVEQNLLFFAYVGFVLVMSQGFLYRRLAKRVSEATFMTWGILLMGLGVLSLGGVTYVASSWNLEIITAEQSIAAQQRLAHFWTLLPYQLASLTICVVGFALLTPSAQALISRRTDDSKQGEILGVNQSASALARILGPVIGLSLYKTTSTHLLPYVMGGALLLLMLPLIPRIRREVPDGKTA